MKTLPEGCVNHAQYNMVDGLHYGPHEANGNLHSCGAWGCHPVEIHPEGTRDYIARLEAASRAVVERWDYPAWDWPKQGPTADLIAELRALLPERAET